MTFLSVYTPTYKRPQALARCKASVAAQTIIVERIHAWKVDNRCRVMCRGHIPNITLNRIMEPRGGHDDFV